MAATGCSPERGSVTRGSEIPKFLRSPEIPKALRARAFRRDSEVTPITLFPTRILRLRLPKNLVFAGAPLPRGGREGNSRGMTDLEPKLAGL